MADLADLAILVMDRGFVLLGLPRQDPDDFMFLVVDQCHTVRRWGTTAGLGQLAREGPQLETVLDSEGDGVRVAKHFVSRIIPCLKEGWASWIASTALASTRRPRR